MQYLNKFFLLLAFYFLSSLPILAGDIIITRKALPGKALLDHKFIFMQGASSFTKNSQPIVKSSKLHSTDKLIPSLIPTKPVSTKIKSLPLASASTQPTPDNWDTYAEEVEMEENLSVGARLLN